MTRAPTRERNVEELAPPLLLPETGTQPEMLVQEEKAVLPAIARVLETIALRRKTVMVAELLEAVTAEAGIPIGLTWDPPPEGLQTLQPRGLKL